MIDGALIPRVSRSRDNMRCLFRIYCWIPFVPKSIGTWIYLLLYIRAYIRRDTPSKETAHIPAQYSMITKPKRKER